MARFKQSPAVLRIIDFSRRHKWAKLFCMGAVSINYANDVISSKLYGPVTKVKKAAGEYTVPVSRRIISGLVCAAFSVMTVPFGAVGVYAAENETVQDGIIADSADNIEEPPADDTEYEETGYSDGDITLPAAVDSGLYEKMLLLTGAAAEHSEEVIADEALQGTDEETDEADLKVSVSAKKTEDEEKPFQIVIKGGFDDDSMSMTGIDPGDRQLEILYRSTEGENAIAGAFKSYGIPPENMNIHAIEISVYDGGQSVEPGEIVKVYVEVPDDMVHHKNDLKAVRLEDGRIEILDSVYARNKDGDLYISFETDHFSTFALVSYADKPENLESEAGEGDVGTPVSASTAGTAAEVKEGRAAAKRKKYRVTKKIRKSDLIF